MKAGLNVLCQMPATYRVAVLADMLELGENTKEYHRLVGEWSVGLIMAEVGVAVLGCCGNHSFGIREHPLALALHDFVSPDGDTMVDRFGTDIRKDRLNPGADAVERREYLRQLGQGNQTRLLERRRGPIRCVRSSDVGFFYLRGSSTRVLCKSTRIQVQEFLPA